MRWIVVALMMMGTACGGPQSGAPQSAVPDSAGDTDNAAAKAGAPSDIVVCRGMFEREDGEVDDFDYATAIFDEQWRQSCPYLQELLEETDWTTHRLWIGSGYEPEAPMTMRDDGDGVVLQSYVYCGGAEPIFVSWVARVPRGPVSFETLGRCEATDIP